MTQSELLARFSNVKRSGVQWTCRCPAHDDRVNSLAVRRGVREWLLYCHAGCGFSQILSALNLKSRDLRLDTWS
ncbi:primase [uncultured Mediterranean phage uvDeep-CGR2-AD3-C191]|nr:primase [uncultured Mediterranean phage uvDeep-CGR2-AD3-C191]